MRRGRPPLRLDAHDLAAEIIRRADRPNDQPPGSYLILLSDPPTVQEQVQLLAADLKDTPVMIASRDCMTETEWAGGTAVRRMPVANRP